MSSWGPRPEGADWWLYLESNRGVVAVTIYEVRGASWFGASSFRGGVHDMTFADLVIQYHGLGFGTVYNRPTVFGPVSGVAFPHWFLALIFAILPAIWLFKWNKRRKLGPNACPSCGYDLTGNESGKCPECGEAMSHTRLAS